MLEYGQKLWSNGEIRDFSDAGKISILVHSLHYGVGAFEGIRAYSRRDGRSTVFRLREHLERLAHSCKLVGIPLEYDTEVLARACLAVLRANELREAYLRPLVLIGVGSLGLASGENPTHALI